MRKLPSWECGNARAQRAMIWWVNSELDKVDYEQLRKSFAIDLTPDERLASLIARADRGNLEPLRRAFPQIARFINFPKRKRIVRNKYDPVGGAAADVKLIRELWRQHYGKFKRAKTDPITAEQIAADRWEVHVDTLLNRLKKVRKTRT